MLTPIQDVYIALRFRGRPSFFLGGKEDVEEATYFDRIHYPKRLV